MSLNDECKRKIILYSILFQIVNDMKNSLIDSKNIFVEHVILLQALLPEIEQCPYSEVEALC